jgi:hypothetical protein
MIPIRIIAGKSTGTDYLSIKNIPTLLSFVGEKSADAFTRVWVPQLGCTILRSTHQQVVILKRKKYVG